MMKFGGGGHQTESIRKAPHIKSNLKSHTHLSKLQTMECESQAEGEDFLLGIHAPENLYDR
jgi:hypothetical protein